MSSELFDNTVNTYKRYISFSHIGSDLMKLLQYHYEGKEGALVRGRGGELVCREERSGAEGKACCYGRGRSGAGRSRMIWDAEKDG